MLNVFSPPPKLVSWMISPAVPSNATSGATATLSVTCDVLFKPMRMHVFQGTKVLEVRIGGKVQPPYETYRSLSVDEIYNVDDFFAIAKPGDSIDFYILFTRKPSTKKSVVALVGLAREDVVQRVRDELAVSASDQQG